MVTLYQKLLGTKELHVALSLLEEVFPVGGFLGLVCSPDSEATRVTHAFN